MSNVAASKKGTVVIEFYSPEHNFCFSMMSMVLGMEYFGSLVSGSTPREIKASLSDVKEILNRFVVKEEK